jgi:hypothetical protein
VQGMGLAEPAVFFHFNTVRIIFFIFHGCIITTFAFAAGQCYTYSQRCHLPHNQKKNLYAFFMNTLSNLTQLNMDVNSFPVRGSIAKNILIFYFNKLPVFLYHPIAAPFKALCEITPTLLISLLLIP